jgi:hypothetical protein
MNGVLAGHSEHIALFHAQLHRLLRAFPAPLCPSTLPIYHTTPPAQPAFFAMYSWVEGVATWAKLGIQRSSA